MPEMKRREINALQRFPDIAMVVGLRDHVLLPVGMIEAYERVGVGFRDRRALQSLGAGLVRDRQGMIAVAREVTREIANAEQWAGRGQHSWADVVGYREALSTVQQTIRDVGAGQLTNLAELRERLTSAAVEMLVREVAAGDELDSVAQLSQLLRETAENTVAQLTRSGEYDAADPVVLAEIKAELADRLERLKPELAPYLVAEGIVNSALREVLNGNQAAVGELEQVRSATRLWDVRVEESEDPEIEALRRGEPRSEPRTLTVEAWTEQDARSMAADDMEPWEEIVSVKRITQVWSPDLSMREVAEAQAQLELHRRVVGIGGMTPVSTMSEREKIEALWDAGKIHADDLGWMSEGQLVSTSSIVLRVGSENGWEPWLDQLDEAIGEAAAALREAADQERVEPARGKLPLTIVEGGVARHFPGDPDVGDVTVYADHFSGGVWEPTDVEVQSGQPEPMTAWSADEAGARLYGSSLVRDEYEPGDPAYAALTDLMERQYRAYVDANGVAPTLDGEPVAVRISGLDQPREQPREGRTLMAAANQQDGYPTSETRQVALWLANDEGLYLQVQEAAGRIARSLPGPEEEDVRLELVDALADELRTIATQEVGSPQPGGSMDEDLLLFSLDEVDWRSLAYDELDEANRELRGADFKLGGLSWEREPNRYDAPAEVIHEALGGKYDGAGVRHQVQQLVRHELTRGPDETWSLGDRAWKNTAYVRVADRLQEYVATNLRSRTDASLASDLIGGQISQEGQWREIAAERLPEAGQSSPVEPPRSTQGPDQGKGRQVGREL